MDNKKLQTTLTWLGIGLLVFLIARRTAAKISIGGASVRIHKLTFDGVELRIDLPVINESDIPAPVSAFLGQIYYGINPIGLVTLVNPVDLPGFGQKVITFAAKLSLLAIGQQVYSILTNPPVDWTKFRIQGTLKIGPLPIDINEPLTAA